MLLLSSVGLISGCSGSAAPQTQAGKSPDALERRFLPSLRMNWGFTARSVLSCPAGDCIVLHHPLKFVRTKGVRDGQFVDDYEQEMNVLLTGDPNTSDDDGEIIYLRPDEWSTEEALGGTQVTYNCCTYAIGEVVGLSESDWISPNALDATDFTVPMQVLLDSYFQLIRSEDLTEIDWRRLESDPSFKDGDIFCLVYTKAGRQQFTHAGKILPKSGRNWFVGKLGRGPVIRSSLAAVGEIYEGQFEKICVYRRLPKAE